ncbi:MAG: hypothetical protein DYG94_00895 [Leptolyngbya sp. PLA3]|nr:MAG: hypothetical protein EDM82_00980 [Cyanobacteria bacterium CYA]MCE7967290.1 hypothetical protein [Leptolyngbya sp. PL-A3]
MASRVQKTSALDDLTRRREVFWQNVVQEILNALSVAAGSGGRLSASAGGAATSPSPLDEMFDGRMAVITRLGQRIPIADVFPVFACSVEANPGDREVSTDVQCTVFQIHTPGGEVFTLPVHEIVAVHSLSEELVRRMEEASQAGHMDDSQTPDAMPFGFAAFTSLANAERARHREEDEGEEAEGA